MKKLSKAKLEKAEILLKMLNHGITKEDFVTSFELVTKYVKENGKKSELEIKALKNVVSKILEGIKTENRADISKVKNEVSKIVASYIKTLNERQLNAFDNLEERVEVAMEERSGEIKEAQKLITETLKKIPPPPELDNGVKIIEKINDAPENTEKIKKEKVEGIKELEEGIKNVRGTRVLGARGVQLYVSGAKKGLVNTLNLIAGSGISLTYNQSNGRNDVTITASASGVSVLTATGTVNGSNTVFVFSSAPTIIVVDGVPKQKTQSDGTANWTGTTTVTLAVAPNYDIYGLG